MRWLVLLLVLLNMAVFGYFRLSQPLHAGVMPGHEAIQPDSLRVVAPEQLEALPQTTVPVPGNSLPLVAEHAACYEWGNFSDERVGNARGVLEKLGADFRIQSLAPQEALRYWVYIPPRKNMERAQAKVEELRALGIEDTFVVKEAQWRYAISLGIFKDESLATRLAEDLRSRGVTNVVKAVRNQGSGQSVFYLKDVTDSRAAEIEKSRPDFPYSELKETACQ